MRIERILLTGLLLGALAGVAAASPILHVSSRSIDFGRIDQFQQVREMVLLRNDGTSPLRILKVDSDCGCTAGALGDSVVAPGREVSMEISFSSRDYQGPQEKSVTIKTNDPAEPTVRISVRADVVPYVKVSSERIRFPTVKKGQGAGEKIRFSAEKGFGLTIASVGDGGEFVTTRVERDPDPKEEAYWLHVDLKTDAPAGPFRKQIDVETGGRLKRTFHVIVTGQIQSYFILRGEPRVVIPAVPKGQSSVAEALITCEGNKPYELLAVETSLPFLRGEIVKKDSSNYSVRIQLAIDAPAGPFRGGVRVRTSDPNQPVLEMMVQGLVRG